MSNNFKEFDAVLYCKRWGLRVYVNSKNPTCIEIANALFRAFTGDENEPAVEADGQIAFDPIGGRWCTKCGRSLIKCICKHTA